MNNIKLLTVEIDYSNKVKANNFKADYIINNQFLIKLRANCRCDSSLSAINYKTGASLYYIEFKENLFFNDDSNKALIEVLRLFRQKLAVLYDIPEDEALLTHIVKA